jgi:hypothetical protein
MTRQARCNRVMGSTERGVGSIALTPDPQRSPCEPMSNRVVLPNSYLAAGHLTHAYAITGHKAQGMTARKAYVLGDETLYREWGYVAMSRGRDENRLYVVASDNPDRDEVGGAVSRARDPMKELVRGHARSRAKDLAVDTYEDEALQGKTSAQLRTEWETITTLLNSRPADPTNELRGLGAVIEELEELQEL